MALLDALVQWAQTDLMPWQSDAVRRLFENTQLQDSDYRELLAQLKHSRGIPVEVLVEPRPLTADVLPTTEAVAASTKLISLGQLRHVNRIADGQELTFGTDGVTVIYGSNGSGKSGYSRVLKSACRARVKDEPVLPDARLHQVSHETPSAIFRIAQGDEPRVVPWQEGQAPNELASVAVLDTRCSRAYTDSEGELIFMPYGLDVVEALARTVFPELERRLRHELSQLDVSKAAFVDLVGPTEVGKLVQALSAETTVLACEALASMTEVQSARLEAVQKLLTEKDPIERIRRLRQEATWLTNLQTRVSAAASEVDDERAEELKQRLSEFLQAEEAQRVAATALQTNELLLPGTGEGPWKHLFDAAARFMSAHLHTDEPLSATEVCPYCQSPTNDATKRRLQRFQDYLKADTAKAALATRESLIASKNKLVQADLNLQVNGPFRDHLAAEATGILAAIDNLQAALVARRDQMLKFLDTSDWEVLLELPKDVSELLQQAVDQLNSRANELEQSQEPGYRASLQKELTELQARQQLAARRQSLLELLGRMKARKALELCLLDLRTRPISDKAKALARGAVTQALTDALNREFRALGVHHLQATLVTRIEEGRPKLRLMLDLPSNAKPERVLSEGEQRVIAIGSFLAELAVSGNQCAAVFDDPVSSLDHQRRHRVAKRLVNEGKQRQVIIFTHDVVFLADLLDQLERQAVPATIHHLTSSDQTAGLVQEGLPWHQQSYAGRLDMLDQQLRKFAAEAPRMLEQQREDWVRSFYGRLRQVTERAVQDVVLNGVINRYSDYVRLPNVSKVVGLTEDDCAPFLRVYQRCGDVIDGHDKARERAFAAPDADEARADLVELIKGIESLKLKRRGANR